MVQEPAHVPDVGGIHKGLHDPPVVQVLPHCYDVVWVLCCLGLDSSASLSKAQDLPSVLAHEPAAGDGLQRAHAPALPLRAEHLQPQLQPPLHQPVLAPVPTLAQAVALKHGPGEVLLLLLCQPEAQAAAVVLPTAQAGALGGHAGAAAAGTAREGDFSGVDLSVCSGHAVGAVLQRNRGQSLGIVSAQSQNF